MTQAEALDILKLGHNVYLTGPAGSGKTHTLNAYIDFLKSLDIPVGITASTGIAATHLNGMTIHAWTGMGINDSLSEKDLEKIVKKKQYRERIRDTHVLVIDEVSMLHAHRLDLVNQVCQFVKENDKPFGGMQVVLCGDLFQLPPITDHRDEEVPFVHTATIWEDMDIRVCYLDEQHRQDDEHMLSVLTDIRNDNVSESTREILRKRWQQPITHSDRPTKLYTHNADVDRINMNELSKLPGDIKTFGMYTKGKLRLVEALTRSCLAPETLKLKKDAVVMFVRNNFEKGYINGSLGVITAFDDEGLPLVTLTTGKVITADVETWKIEENDETLASITQIPLRLAWAITVHKSQGMSLDAAEVDLGKSFVPGMGYVALSRVRSLDGLKLTGFNENAFKVHPLIQTFDSTLRKDSEHSVTELNTLSPEEKEKRQKEYLARIKPKEKPRELTTLDQTKALLDNGLSIEEIVEKREMTEQTVIGHIEKLRDRGEDIDIEYLKPAPEVLDEILEAFEKSEDTKLAPVRALLKNKYSYRDIQIARLFL